MEAFAASDGLKCMTMGLLLGAQEYTIKDYTAQEYKMQRDGEIYTVNRVSEAVSEELLYAKRTR